MFEEFALSLNPGALWALAVISLFLIFALGLPLIVKGFRHVASSSQGQGAGSALKYFSFGLVGLTSGSCLLMIPFESVREASDRMK